MKTVKVNLQKRLKVRYNLGCVKKYALEIKFKWREVINLPLVHIDLLAGRTPEQLKQMAADVTTAIAKNANVPADDIHIVLNEMPHDHYFVAGKEKGAK